MSEAIGATKITFSGEESHRFTRLAQQCLAMGSIVRVVVDGREPLTSRAIHIEGNLIDAQLDGYMRLVVVEEYGSGIRYWVAGSNSIRSMATRQITFWINKPDLDRLQAIVVRGSFIPGIARIAPGASEDWARLDSACADLSHPNLALLLNLLDSADLETAREAALALRGFSLLANRRKADQLRVERDLLSALARVADRDTRIALTEDLGYSGTRASLPTLRDLVNHAAEDDHVRWAAGVAISRYTGDEVIPPLIQLLRSSSGWTAAGALLGLSRHASAENQLTLEPVFREYLALPGDAILIRYACLGVARFTHLDDSTLRRLLDIMSGSAFEIDVTGFVALAVSGCLTSLSAPYRDAYTASVRQIPVPVLTNDVEPELVWGQEFLAELATLQELNSEASELYQSLADYFLDWRSNYYHAMSLYQRAEALCSDGRAQDALLALQEAVDLLDPSLALNDGDMEAITFRREIVRARLELQEALAAWVDSLDTSQVEAVARGLDDVMGIYARYTRPNRSAMGIKRLSDREVDYLRKSHGLLQVLQLILSLQIATDRGSASAADVIRESSKLLHALEVLHEKFADHLAEGPNKIVERCLAAARQIAEILQHGQRQETYGALQEQISAMKKAFSQGTWPMPARSCPAGGLGRGTISILQEEIPGAGTQADPYRVPANSPPVINVVAEIYEMAPGGTCVASVQCDIAGQHLIQRLSAVEGSCRATLVLPNVFSPLSATRCDIQLLFTARDCSQPAANLELYLRREGG